MATSDQRLKSSDQLDSAIGDPGFISDPIAGVRGPMPMVVGITGHRDIDAADIPELMRKIAEIFEERLSAYRRTPLLLLSPLATGADRIAARVAMSPRFRIPIIVPLPIEREEYRRDFNPEEVVEFDAMMEDAFCAFFVGYAPGNDATRVANDHEARNLQYAQVGSYIARQSQLLIALWNGVESDAVGGTAQIIKFKREGVWPGYGPQPLSPVSVDNGTVYHVVTPRMSHDAIEGGKRFQIIRLGPIFRSASTLFRECADPEDVQDATYRRIDRFNRDALGSGFTDAKYSTETLRAAADMLAEKYRHGTNRTINLLFGTAFVASLLFEYYAHWRAVDTIYLTIYVILSAAAFVFYLSARDRDLQSRYLDYRAIAEGLRIQEFWHRISLRETVADHYLRSYRGELDWIRNAISVCRLLDRSARIDEAADLITRKADLLAVYRDWIDGASGQIAYFANRIGIQTRRKRNWQRTSMGLFLTSFVLSVFLALASGPLLHFFPHWIDFKFESDAWRRLILLISTTAVASALVQGYIKIHAYGEHIKQYRRMQDVYVQSKNAMTLVLERPSFTDADYTEAQRILKDLGEDALAEHGAWVMLHRERPLEYVRGA